MKNNSKRIISAIAALAMSATAVAGAVSFSACSNKFSYVSKSVTNNVNANVMQISTAAGVVDSQTSGKTYYVSTTATKDGDGSEANPYNIATILNSTSILKPGDTVLVQPGVYTWDRTWASDQKSGDSIVITVSGEYNKYITIKNASDTEEAILDFSGQTFDSTNRGVQLEGDYIYWYGIDIRGAGDNGMYVAGDFNTIENCEFYNNRDTGLQIGRAESTQTSIKEWPSYNLVKNCTSHNNYDNETYGENADGFAAKLTVGYGNVFDGCIAYRNSDDGWDLYAKTDSGNIGQVLIYNCVAYENGYLEYTQQECNKLFPTWTGVYSESSDKTGDLKYGLNSYVTRDGDGNGFKLGGSVMEGDVVVYNCLSFGNRMHGVTDNSNPGVISVNNVTSYNNSAAICDDETSDYFGQIFDVSNSETHGNINVARQTYSYNNFSGVLSVKDDYAKSLEADEYRGSVTDSIFIGYKVDGSLDADTKVGGSLAGTKFTAPAASDIFETLPYVKSTTGEGADATTTYTFNVHGKQDLGTISNGEITALSSTRAHKLYRNADGSINMGNILKVKDYSNLLGDSKPVGSVLNKTSYEDYTHFAQADVSANPTLTGAILAKAKDVLTINCNADAVYQDFDVPASMKDCKITWVSSDKDVLEVAETADVSTSKSEYLTVYVYRPLTSDTTATLTATIEYNGETTTKEFEVTVKAGKPSIGDITVKAPNGSIIGEGGSYIVDQYAVFEEPAIYVENGLDYNGKLLKADQYSVKTVYSYQTDKNAAAVEIKDFTPSNAGVYTVTKTVTLLSDKSTKVLTYTLFVASSSAQADFSGEADIVANRDGYSISGLTSSATGTIYAVSSSSELSDLTVNNIKSYECVESYSFRAESITAQFTNANTGAYNVYYAFANANGQITSKLYTAKIGVVEISSEEDFMKVAGGEKLGEENPALSIYSLTRDLDYTNKTWTVGASAFKGLLNGNGHTVSNLTVEATGKDNVGVFYKVTNGTIMNIKFDNLSIDGGSKNKVALVTEVTGGNFYNIKITNANITSKGQRVSALVATVNVGDPVYIEQVSVVNDSEHSISGQQRVGGLIGFCQANSSLASGSMAMYVSNCYVNTDITAEYELGGIMGTFDGGNNKNINYFLSVDHCVTDGTITATGSKTYSAGILGYQKGAYSAMSITNCATFVTLMFNGAKVATSLKNCSGIVGCSTTVVTGLSATVNNCIAFIEEYNTNFNVTAYTLSAMSQVSRFNSKGIDLDEDCWTLNYAADSTTSVEAPYVSLNFLGDWN